MDTNLHIATQEIIEKVHAYMRLHPESELHTCGKMFGVLVVRGDGLPVTGDGYLAAFSAKLDGSYYHEGFVPPVWDKGEGLRVTGYWEPVGHSKEESRRLQRLLFANYKFVNGKGETKNLLEIFKNEKPIVPPEEWFGKEGLRVTGYGLRDTGYGLRVTGYGLREDANSEKLPPSGAGECCAPKLLQYALTHGLKPIALAEFWVGAPSKTEIRQEGAYYAPCSGRCGPILKHMTQGLEGLQVTGYGLRDTGYGLRDTGYGLQVTGYGLQVTGYGKPEILFEDEWMMVVNKPAGLLSVPGKGDEPSVEDYFKYQISNCKFIKAVHRLDQDTSGLLVLAKTPEVYKELQAYFQRRDILKRYEAVLRPNDEMSRLRLNDANDGVIDLPLLPNPYDRPRQMVDKEHGKPAITRYVIRKRRDDGTMLVDFYPLTGRTHQLRVHAAHPEGLNAPIVGDRLYGDGLQVTGYGKRLMLHAAEIRFVHPVTLREMHFCEPAPEWSGV